MSNEFGLGERLSAVAKLAEAMLSVEPHGWLGRTHIQKAVYFAQEILETDLGYEFTIYQYGPYAAALDSDLSQLLGMRALHVKQVDGYPDYARGENIDPLLRYFQRSPVASTANALEKVAKIVAPRKSRELELLTTLLYLKKRGHSGNELIQALRRLKPHFDEETIKKGILDLDEVERTLHEPR